MRKYNDSEYMDTLNKLWMQRNHLPEVKYFLDTEFAWTNHGTENAPKIVILGTNIPEELISVSGIQPYWIIGGSLNSVAWSDKLVPRDTDPVSRSILGWIHQPDGFHFSDSLLIIPLISDSMRKFAYQLKEEGYQTCLIDIPPEHSANKAKENYQKQMLSMTETVSKHTGIRITKSSLTASTVKISKARYTLRKFLDISSNCTEVISDVVRIMIQDSYYRTANLEEWTYQLEELTATITELKNYITSPQDKPKIIIMGSPIIFPNYKIPFLVQEAGMEILETIDSSVLKQYLIYSKDFLQGSKDTIIKNIASAWYQRDASSAFIQNDTMFGYISQLIQKKPIEGVVYHVLKGQTEYDFELERFETLFSKYGIPVFRLETDYQYQDAEQLRIRLEAFSEMLTQNRYRKAVNAL